MNSNTTTRATATLDQSREKSSFNFLDLINLDESDGTHISDEKLFEIIGEIKE